MGAKTRHAAEIIGITTANRKLGQVYCEPFCGGGNVICRVPHDQGPRIGADINKYMIALLDAVGNRGWLPPETMSKEEWLRIKHNQDQYPDELVAWAAVASTFGSGWFSAWVEHNNKGDTHTRYSSAFTYLCDEAPFYRGVQFQCTSFEKLVIPSHSIVYCDPPYYQTAGYSAAKTDILVDENLSKNTWDVIKFWRWADSLVDAGHQVFVSEYIGPSPSVYRSETPELAAEMRAAKDKFRALQADPQSSREDRESAILEIKAVDKKVQNNRVTSAARWSLVWEKDDHKGLKHAEHKPERLFHRTP